jgi:hypothetical protein
MGVSELIPSTKRERERYIYIYTSHLAGGVLVEYSKKSIVTIALRLQIFHF